MKKLLLCLFLLPVIAYAQGEISVSIGGNYLIQMPKNVDALTKTTTLFQYSLRVPVKGAWSFHPALGFTSTRYIMDGIFSKQNGDYSFGLSPDSFKQSYLQLYSVRMPLLARYVLSSYNNPRKPERVRESSVAFGPYIDYIFSAKQYYKIREQKYKENALIENKLTFGLAAEVTALKGNRNAGDGFSLSLGMMYQLSEYLSGKNSFKPLLLYLRIGMGGVKKNANKNSSGKDSAAHTKL